MPVLKNARHELFCQERAKGKSLTDAYIAAGYKDDRHNASHLADKPEISDRIQQLTTKYAETAAITVASITEMLKADRDLARECKQTSAAVAAAKSIGELHGLYVERVKTEVEHRFVARIPDKKDDATEWQTEHTPEHPTVN